MILKDGRIIHNFDYAVAMLKVSIEKLKKFLEDNEEYTYGTILENGTVVDVVDISELLKNKEKINDYIGTT